MSKASCSSQTGPTLQGWEDAASTAMDVLLQQPVVKHRVPPDSQMCMGEEWCACSEQRVGLVRRAADGSVKGVSTCEPHRLQLAVSQLLDDMEEKEAIPDR